MSIRMNRRMVLRGAGVALALPWLESLAPRAASAQVSAAPKRFLPIFFPNGAAEFWRPSTVGKGNAWQLSPILQPFESLKQKLIVLSNLENYTPFKQYASEAQLFGSHGQSGGAWLTCADAETARTKNNTKVANGISVDQLIAQDPAYEKLTKIPSLQLGISTCESYCDGPDYCPNSRSISWKSDTSPTYKEVDPGAVFDAIVSANGTAMPGTPDPEADKRRALGKSVLDAVLTSASSVRDRLGSADQRTLDQFMDSVRSVEKSTSEVSGGLHNQSCTIGARPTLKAQPKLIYSNVKDPAAMFYPYSKEEHANVMNDLIVMALQCDVTRVISYMLEDERSEFVYSHVPTRAFTATGSAPGTGGTCGEYHASQHAGDTNNTYASINWWQSTKVAALAQRLDAIDDGDGKTLLDNTVMLYGSGMHGGNHRSNQLPLLLIGGGSGTLETDQHVDFPATIGSDRPLRDLYFTLLQKTFGLPVTGFGEHSRGQPCALITEILKS